jgi:hypothetical protein
MHAGSTAGVHEQTASLLRRHGMWSRLAAGAFSTFAEHIHLGTTNEYRLYTIDIPNNHRFFDIVYPDHRISNTVNHPRRVSAARRKKTPHATWVSSRVAQFLVTQDNKQHRI